MGDGTCTSGLLSTGTADGATVEAVGAAITPVGMCDAAGDTVGMTDENRAGTVDPEVIDDDDLSFGVGSASIDHDNDFGGGFDAMTGDAMIAVPLGDAMTGDTITDGGLGDPSAGKATTCDGRGDAMTGAATTCDLGEAGGRAGGREESDDDEARGDGSKPAMASGKFWTWGTSESATSRDMHRTETSLLSSWEGWVGVASVAVAWSLA